MIRCFLEEGQKCWDDQLPLLLAAYRRTQHSATKCTSNKLMFRREVYQSQDDCFHPAAVLRHGENGLEYVEKLEKSIDDVQEMARKHQKVAKRAQNRHHDLSILTNTYETGDLVHILNTGRKKGSCLKLQSIYKGPFVVSKVHRPLIYEVRNKVRKTLYHTKLKPYHSKFIPGWVAWIQGQVQGVMASDVTGWETGSHTDLIMEPCNLHQTDGDSFVRVHCEFPQVTMTNQPVGADLAEITNWSSLRIPVGDQLEVRKSQTRFGRSVQPTSCLDL